MTVAYLGLGANVGDRERNLAEARRLLAERGARLLRESSIRETEPYGVTRQPRFLNQVVEVDWRGSARELLAAARAVETAVGRTPTYRWGPREIDVDILLFGDQVVNEPDLVIPHPGLRQRDFVLQPLAELRPDILTQMCQPRRPVRVAWLGHRSATGADGIITYSREITNGLRERGVEVLFLHHARDQADDQSIALNSFALSHRLVLSPPSAKRKLLDVLRLQEVDLVHVSLAFSSLDFNLPRICHQLGIPIVATFHVPYDTRFSVWRGISAAVYRLYAQALAECDAVIIFGETQREMLAALGVPRQSIQVLPNGVDVDRYRPGPSHKRAEFGAERMFTYLGRLDPEKNVDMLLAAFLDAEPPEATRLVVVGGGVERRRLERRYADPRVILTGVVTDEQERIDILRASDAFFLPSSVEGLSLAMLEAMACGAATVATDVGNDGEALRGAGIVLDPGHLESELRAAIRLLLEVPQICATFGRLARERAVTRYSLAANLDALLELYGRLTRLPL